MMSGGIEAPVTAYFSHSELNGLIGSTTNIETSGLTPSLILHIMRFTGDKMTQRFSLIVKVKVLK